MDNPIDYAFISLMKALEKYLMDMDDSGSLSG
jgi:hypothetical protein